MVPTFVIRSPVRRPAALAGASLALPVPGTHSVLVSASEWASIEETLYLLSSPANAKRLLEAVRGFEAEEPKAVSFP